MEEDYVFDLSSMDSNLEGIIMFLIRHEDFDAAAHEISMTLGQIPNQSVLCAVVYDLLMKTSTKSTALNTLRYLMKMLDFYPPNDSLTRTYYFEALSFGNDKKVKVKFWDIFANIIRNCLHECDVLKKPTKINHDKVVHNSQFLLQYFVKLLSVEFDYFSEKRRSSSTKKKKNCLVAQLFWTARGIISVASESCCELLSFINEIYKHKIDYVKMLVLEKLQELLCLVGKYLIFYEGKSEIQCVAYSQYLDDYAQVICRICGGIFETEEKLEAFLMAIEVRWLRIKICENMLYKILHRCWLPHGTASALTLRKIIREYMFPPSKDSSKLLPPDSLKRSQRSHVKEKNTQRLSVRGANRKGLTPLHQAVILDSVANADRLLKNGGMSLLYLKDKKGMIPECYLRSKEMRALFKRIEKSQKLRLEKTENIHNVDSCTRTPPSFNDEKSFCTYILLLYFMLVDYIEIFQLDTMSVGNKSLEETVERHLIENCDNNAYQPTIHDVVARMDDLLCMKYLSATIHEFSRTLTAKATNANVDISEPLISFEFMESLFKNE